MLRVAGATSLILGSNPGVLVKESTTYTESIRRPRFQYEPLSVTTSSTRRFHYAPLSSTTTRAFYYAPLSTFSSSSRLDLPSASSPTTLPSKTVSSSTVAAATTNIVVPNPGVISESAGPPMWFVITTLVCLFCLLALAVLLWRSSSKEGKFQPRKVRQQAKSQQEPKYSNNIANSAPQPPSAADEAFRSPSTAIEDRQRAWQDLRQRKRKDMIVGNIGDESRPRNMFAVPETEDLEAHILHRAPRHRRGVGLGISGLDEQLSPKPNFMSTRVSESKASEGNAERAVETGDEEASVDILGRVIEIGAEIAVRAWRSHVHGNAEEGLLLPIRSEEREEGEKGRNWLTADMARRKDL